MKAEALARLRALADLRAQKSGQALMRAQTAIAELEGRADALRTPIEAGAGDIALEIARDRHARWRSEQLRTLNLEIAGRRAHAEPLRLAHGRDR
ncbi:MAG: hypothetical protein AAF390_00005, partial [Pseudomonadota bacterium]